MKEGDDEVKEVRAAKNVNQELLVEFKHLPDQNVEFLGEEDLLYRARKVRLEREGRGGAQDKGSEESEHCSPVVVA